MKRLQPDQQATAGEGAAASGHKSSLFLQGLTSLGFLFAYVSLHKLAAAFEMWSGVSAWYPPPALGLALMLGLGLRYAPVVLLAAMLGPDLGAQHAFIGFELSAINVISTTGYAAAAAILRPRLRGGQPLRSLRDVGWFLSVVLCSSFVVAFLGTLSLVSGGHLLWSQYPQAAFNWWVGDAVPMVGLTPFLMGYVMPWLRRKCGIAAPAEFRAKIKREGGETAPTLFWVAELGGQAASLILFLWAIFGFQLSRHYELFYLLFVPIIWVAVRHGLPGATAAVLAANLGVLVAFRLFGPQAGQLATLQVLLFTVSLTGLCLGAVISERRKSQTDLEEQTTYLNVLIENNPLAIVAIDVEGCVRLCNAAFQKLFGFSQREVIGQIIDNLAVPKDSLAEAADIWLRAAAGEYLHLTSRRQRKDGTLVDVEIHAVPMLLGGRLVGAYAIYEDISARRKAEELLREARDKLSASLEEAEQRAREIAQLSELGSLLQSCKTPDEALTVVRRCAEKLLPVDSGALCLINASRNLVELREEWGVSAATDPLFSPDDCWALRRGRTHIAEDSGAPRCGHLGSSDSCAVLCVPLMAQGEALGILVIRNTCAATNADAPQRFTENRLRLAVAVAEQAALGLANLKLRATLQDQAIRDPLTGLFNRRYMEESLERELCRAGRQKGSVAVILFDIDHFKRFNDTFGHQAGDTVLREIGNLLKKRTRGQDVASRYGGEEFALILSNASADAAARRAEMLREEVSQISPQYRGQVLGTVSLSMGVAAYPDHGSTTIELLRAVDLALYQAKEQGRDRVVVAEVGMV